MGKQIHSQQSHQIRKGRRVLFIAGGLIVCPEWMSTGVGGCLAALTILICLKRRQRAKIAARV
jgi:hypothetical protein